MKILLVCSAGMSTSLVVEKMKAAAVDKGLDAEIIAIPLEEFENQIKNYDVALLGPQIKFKKDEFQKIAENYGKKVDVINTMDYAMLNGEKVLNFAIGLTEKG